MTLIPGAEATLQADDILVVQAEGNNVARAAAHWNLGLQPAAQPAEAALITQEAGIAEVIVRPRSNIAGQTLVESQFGTAHGLTVLGICRPGTTDRLDLKTKRLRPGDVLLVQGPWKNFLALKDMRRDFVVIGQPEAMTSAPKSHKAGTAILIVALMLALMMTAWLPVATAALLAALALVLTGCLTIDEAYQSIDWRSVILIAGMLPMAIALEQVGLVQLVAAALTHSLGGFGPAMIIGGLFLLTSLFTQVLSNTTTTVLLAPVALASAQALGARPEAFLMAVAVAASMAFATPVASPVNTLVMGAGGYRFGDYARAGLPMTLLTLVASVVVLLLLFPA
jgi:di/tricarboxylate transporter